MPPARRAAPRLPWTSNANRPALHTCARASTQTHDSTCRQTRSKCRRTHLDPGVRAHHHAVAEQRRRQHRAILHGHPIMQVAATHDHVRADAAALADDAVLQGGAARRRRQQQQSELQKRGIPGVCAPTVLRTVLVWQPSCCDGGGTKQGLLSGGSSRAGCRALRMCPAAVAGCPLGLELRLAHLAGCQTAQGRALLRAGPRADACWTSNAGAANKGQHARRTWMRVASPTLLPSPMQVSREMVAVRLTVTPMSLQGMGSAVRGGPEVRLGLPPESWRPPGGVAGGGLPGLETLPTHRPVTPLPAPARTPLHARWIRAPRRGRGKACSWGCWP